MINIYLASSWIHFLKIFSNLTIRIKSTAMMPPYIGSKLGLGTEPYTVY